MQKLKAALVQLNRWITICPGTFLTVMALTGCAIGLGWVEGWYTDDISTSLWFWCIMAFTVGIFAASFLRNRHRLMSCLLAACLFNAQVWAGVSGGLFCWQAEEYCPAFEASSEPPPINAAVLQIIVRDGQPIITSIRHIPEKDMVSAEDANVILAQWGLNWTGHTTEQYAVNGKPADPSQVPFTYTAPGLITLYPERPQYTIVIESASQIGASDYWTPLLVTKIPKDTLICVEDLTISGHGFYRVRLADRDPFQPAGPIALGIGAGLLISGGYVCYRVAKCAAKRAKDRQPKPASTNDLPQNPNQNGNT